MADGSKRHNVTLPIDISRALLRIAKEREFSNLSNVIRKACAEYAVRHDPRNRSDVPAHDRDWQEDRRRGLHKSVEDRIAEIRREELDQEETG